MEAMTNLGCLRAGRALLSFAAAALGPQRELTTFEEWVTRKFGRKLYEVFFKTYTEKVWGIPCSHIGAEWAAQRIKGLDLVEAAKHALGLSRSVTVKTLADEFYYPVGGAGKMYEAMAEKVVAMGARLRLGTSVRSIHHAGGSITGVETVDPEGNVTRVHARHYFASLPLTNFFKMLTPLPPDAVRMAVDALYYRDHITVDLLVDRSDLFSDQWIYVHSGDVKMARIANYGNFSRAMVTPDKSALSIEYFAFQSDELWKSNDDDLIALGIGELQHIGLTRHESVEAARVVRETECYPAYYLGFREPYERLRNHIDQFANLAMIGRAGMYNYGNQDHAAMSGLLAARNYLRLPGSPRNLWQINIDEEYNEDAVSIGAM